MKQRRDLNLDKLEQFLLIDSILKLTGKSRATVNRWVRNGSFPAPYKIAGSILWKRSEYNKWAKQLEKVRY